MPTVHDVLAIKGASVHFIPATATVLEATRKMNQHKIGALVVTEEGQVAGIFTERDVLSRVVVEQREPSGTLVGEVMTRELICCPPETDLDDVSAIMKTRRIRHVPVLDGEGQIQGLISIGDLNAFHASEREATIYYLSEYIYGRV